MSYPNILIALEGFLLHMSASGRSHYTIRNYKNQIGRLAKWIEDAAIDKISSNDIDSFMKYLIEDYRITHIGTCPTKPRKLSKKTIYNAWGALSSFWKWVEKEYQIINPFKVAPIKVHTKPVYPLKRDEVSRLVKACSFTNKEASDGNFYKSKRFTAIRDRAVLLMLLDTGVRSSELLGINVNEIDFETGRIRVKGKGEKYRFVYLGRLSKQAIWKYVSSRFPKHSPPKDEPLFVNYSGIHRMTRSGLAILIKRLGQTVSVERVHPHRFRHTFAIEFLRNGGNVFELQQLLGHNDLAMVKRYVRLSQMDLETSSRRASPADNWRL